MNDIELDEEDIFHAARRMVPGDSRDGHLRNACGHDADLLERLREMLRLHDQEENFLEVPPFDATLELVAPEKPPESTIGPYKILELIGEGGMGSVYMADQTHPLRRKVALKVIKPGMDSKQVVARFEAERQALAMMDHPNIARVLDAGTTTSGSPYFVMELVRGIPITEYCDREQLSISERLELFVLVCRAVQHAHQKGIIHRDIKPSNVLITLHDGVPVPKVIDFGIAKATGQALTDKTLYTCFSQLVGTPLYMSPEQAELSGLDIDTRSDIYSLGVLFYELLTGTTPFDGDTLRKAAFDEMRRIIREQEPQKPSARLSSLGNTLSEVSAMRGADPRRLNRSVRGELDWIAMKTLEKDRRRRYETVNDLAADVLRHLTHQQVEACPPSAGYRLAKYLRRHRGKLGTALIVVLSLIAGTVASVWQAVRATRAELLVQEDFRRALDAVDRNFIRIAEDLGSIQGTEQIRRALLRESLQFYQGFLAAHANDRHARREAAHAGFRVGAIHQLLGDLDRVDAPVRLAIDLLKPLVAVARPSAEDRAELAECLTILAEVCSQSRRLTEGVKMRREALAIATALAIDEPRNSVYRRRHAGVECNLGLALCTEGTSELDEAEVHLRSALKTWERCQADFPGQPENRDESARLHLWLGHLLSRRESWAEAEKEFRKSLSYLELELAAVPAKPAVIDRLAHIQGYLSKLMFRQGHYPQAERFTLAAIGHLEPLCEAWPHVAGYRRHLGFSVGDLARVHRMMNRPVEADGEFRKALSLWDGLVVDHPGTTSYLDYQATTFAYYGLFLHETGRFDDATEAFRRCVALWERHAALLPSDAMAQAELAWWLSISPTPQVLDGVRAEVIATKATELDPRSEEAWRALGAARCLNGAWESAIAALGKSIELDPADRRAPILLSISHSRRGDGEQARVWLERAYRISDEPFATDQLLVHLRADAEALIVELAAQAGPRGTSVRSGLRSQSYK